MPTLDEIRAAGEAKIAAILTDTDAEVRGILRDALQTYHRVENIPDSVWERIKQHYADNDRLTYAVLLLFVMGDDWTAGEMERQGVALGGSRVPMSDYARDAAANVASLADTVDTIKSRLQRRVQDSRLTGPGGIGELTDEGIDEAIDDVLTAQRAETIATDQTTGAITSGQIGARDRTVGDDGAAETIDGQRMTVALVWKTELDNLVCPRCRPLEGMTEDVWGMVFPEGPGDEAHPNCRCFLLPTLVPFTESDQ